MRPPVQPQHAENDPLADMPLWVYRATVRANVSHPRPRLSRTLSLGHAGDGYLSGGVAWDGTVPNPLPEDDEEDPYSADHLK